MIFLSYVDDCTFYFDFIFLQFKHQAKQLMNNKISQNILIRKNMKIKTMNFQIKSHKYNLDYISKTLCHFRRLQEFNTKKKKLYAIKKYCLL